MKKNWIKISEQKPKEGQIIALCNRAEGYIGETKDIDEITTPFLTRWYADDHPEREEYREGELVIYTSPLYWFPVPEYKDLKIE